MIQKGTVSHWRWSQREAASLPGGTSRISLWGLRGWTAKLMQHCLTPVKKKGRGRGEVEGGHARRRTMEKYKSGRREEQRRGRLS